MTICIGIKFLSGVALIADSRVEWQPYKKYSDILQKIYKLGKNSGIAFSGDIYTAGKLLVFIGNQISDDDTILTLKPKLTRWLRFGYSQLQKNRARKVSFLIVGIETSRKSLQALNFNKGYIIRYDSPKFDPIIHTDKCNNITCFDVIGSGSVIKDELRKEFDDLINFSPFNVGNQLLVFMTDVKSILNKKKILNVGGLLQLGFFDSTKCISMGYSVKTHQGSKIIEDYSLEFRNGRYYQVDKTSNKELKLNYVWEELKIIEDTFKY